MRIAMFSQWWPPEPATIIGSLGRELSLHGHNVQVVTGFPNYPTGELYPGFRVKWRAVQTDNELRTIRVPLYPSHDRSVMNRGANYLSYSLAAATIGVGSLQRADVAYVYHPPISSAWPANVLRWTRGVPFVLHVLDLWPDAIEQASSPSTSRSRLIGWSLGKACAAAYRSAARIVTISDGFKGALVDRGVPEEKIEVIQNWADESLLPAVEPSPRIRAMLGPSNRRILLYAGNLGPFQALDRIVRAMAAIESEARLDLVLLGEGMERRALEQLVRQLRLSNVRFLPRVSPEEAAALQASADVLLVSLDRLPFLDLTIPGKTQSYLASGKAIFAAVRGDAATLLSASEACVVASDGDAGLIEALLRLDRLTDEEVGVLGSNGASYYERNLRLDLAVERFERIFRDVGRRN